MKTTSLYHQNSSTVWLKIAFVMILILLINSVKGQYINDSIAKKVASTFITCWVTEIELSDTNKIQEFSYLKDELELENIKPFYHKLKAENQYIDSLYHIFDIGGKGFIIISAQKTFNPVIAFSPLNIFPQTNLPNGLRIYLSILSECIRNSYSENSTTSIIQKKWDLLLSGNYNPVNPIGPLLGEIKWDQWSPFNKHLTEVTQLQLPVGCVTTAMAQIMKYYNYPLIGVGSFDYNESGKDPDLGNLSATFNDNYYDWDLYSDNATGNLAPNNLPELFYEIAVSIETDYSIDNDGNYSGGSYLKWPGQSDAYDSFKNFFDYPNIEYKAVDYGTNFENWKSKIRNEIDYRRPVLYSGRNHAFVCDGYDQNDRFYFNWGWSGSGNGWFLLNEMIVNGSDYSFERLITDMLINIEPNQLLNSPDKYEADGQFELSTFLDRSTTQTHSIAPVGDEDYFKFYLTNTATVNLETIGVNGNTQLWLYDGSKNFLEYDDDSGDGENSLITTELGPGSYYFMVEEKGGTNNITSYIIDFEIQSSGNRSPILSNAKVTPTKGLPDTFFEFSVKYFDEDGDNPTFKKVHIFGPAEKSIQLSRVSGVDANGIYSATTQLPEGSYRHFFEMSDGNTLPIITDVYYTPNVFPAGSFITISPENIEYPSENIEITLTATYQDNSNKRWEWTASQLPADIELNSDADLMFSIYFKSKNHDFKKWKFIMSDGEIRERMSSGSGFHLNGGSIVAKPYIDYAPEHYNISGIIQDELGNPFAGEVYIEVSNDAITKNNTFSNGSFEFSEVWGGLPVTVSPVTEGYTFGPASFYFRNLDENKTNLVFKATSGDIDGPKIELINYPPYLTNTGIINISWTGFDNTTPVEQIEYRYRLVDIVDWSDWNTINTFERELENGVYIFEIEAKDNCGNISNPSYEIVFAINSNPKLDQHNKVDNMLYGSLVKYSSDNTSDLSNSVILPMYFQESKQLVPLKVFLNGTDQLLCVHPSLVTKYPNKPVLTETNNFYELNLKEILIDSPQIIELIIEWGHILNFGWQPFKEFPKDLSQISNDNNYMREVANIIPKNDNFYRFWDQTKRRNSIWGNKSTWAFLDIFNNDGIQRGSIQLENINGVLDDGQYAEEYEITDLEVIQTQTHFIIAGIVNHDKKTYIEGEKVYLYYQRYFIKKIDLLGNIIDEFHSEWTQDVNYSLAPQQKLNLIVIVKKEYHPYQYYFQVIDTELNITDPVKFAENQNYIDSRGVYNLGNKLFFFYQEGWETPESDDRQVLWMRSYDLNSSNLGSPVLLSNEISPDNIEKDDEFYYESIFATNNHVLVCYSRYFEGVTFNEKILDINSNIINNQQLSGYKIYLGIDINSNLWEVYDNKLKIVDDSYQILQEVPNNNTLYPKFYNNGVEIFTDRFGYYKRFSPGTVLHGFELESNIDVNSILVIPYDQNKTQSLLNNLDVKIAETEVGHFTGDLLEVKEINSSGMFHQGYNTISFRQDSYIGGDLIINFFHDGEEETFTDPRDGHKYKIIIVGAQTWMAENLAYLPTVNTSSNGSDSEPKYYVYGYEGTDVTIAKATDNYNTHGSLYNWEAAKTACPDGWYLPTDEEWKTMEKYLGMSESAANNNGYRSSGDVGNKLKSTYGWNQSGNGIDSEGFNGLPSGNRYGSNGFGGRGNYARFWSSTPNGSLQNWYRGLGYDDGSVLRDNRGWSAGFSVRCLQGSSHTIPTVTTAGISNITETTAEVEGNITDNGGTAVTARGVCWNTNPDPAITDNITIDGTGTGNFTSSITGLTPNTTYYYQAYATNIAGTAYGDEGYSFITLNNDATLNDLQVDGSTIDGFNLATISYDYELSCGATIVPTVTATTNDPNASFAIHNVNSLPGTTLVIVTAADGTTTQTYSINFVFAEKFNTPDWTNPIGVQYSMTIHAQVTVYGRGLVISDCSLLAGFNGEDCIGVAEIRIGPAGKQFNLSLGANLDQISGITFKVYDYATDEVVPISEKLDFVNNTVAGLVYDPLLFHAGMIEQIISLVNGWNWMSINTLPEDKGLDNVLQNFPGLDNDEIKTAPALGGSATYYNGQWWGLDGGIQPCIMYLLNSQTSTPGDLSIIGYPVDVSTPIPIVENWNWIGFNPQSSMNLATALASLESENNDEIKTAPALGGSATYYNGQWWGLDGGLKPGVGYLLNSSKVDDLIYPDGSISAPIVINIMDNQKSENDNSWTNPTGNLYTMTVHAKVVLPTGDFLEAPDSKLTAFKDNECRSVFEIFDGPAGYQFQLAVASDLEYEEDMVYIAYDAGNNKIYAINEKLDFVFNTTLGKIYDPEYLTIGSTLDIDEYLTRSKSIEFKLYPNPFTDKLNISFTNHTHQKVRVAIYGVKGQMIKVINDRRYEPGNHNIVWDSNNLPNGVYYIMLQTEEFVRNQKVVKVK